MKKIVGILTAVSMLAMASPALAAPAHLKYGPELNRKACDGASGAPIINVTQKVVNDADSGFGGYWAFDNYTRHIQVWSVGEDTYCATVQYDGKFAAVDGQTSPGTTGILDGTEKGSMKGGYRATVTGTLLTTPTWATHGSVGTTDYQCDLSGTCPGAVSWLAQYFNGGYGFDYQFWGWEYRGGHDGTWINADSGSTGDIL